MNKSTYMALKIIADKKAFHLSPRIASWLEITSRIQQQYGDIDLNRIEMGLRQGVKEGYLEQVELLNGHGWIKKGEDYK